MKKLYYLLFLGLPTLVNAQATITSTSNGNASSPLTWDCFCFPSTDDNIIINHNVAMDVDWLVNGGGSITVNASGSLLQNGTHSLAIDGAGSVLNVSGQFKMENISVTNSAGVHTFVNGTLRVNNGIYVGSTANYLNQGSTLDVDSLLTEGTFQQDGVLMAGDLLNTGTFYMNGETVADSLGNTGTINFSGGYTYATAFGTSGIATLSDGFIHTDANMYNSGTMTTSAGTLLECLGSFYSGDTIMGTALLDMNGLLTVAQDLYFSEDVQGSGDICVNGDSYNAATVQGTLDVCDVTATMNGFDFNIGSVAGTITFCSPGCSVSLKEEKIVNWNVVPNPAKASFKLIGLTDVEKVQIVDMTGGNTLLVNGEFGNFNIEVLPAGVYFVLPMDAKNVLPVKLIVE